VDPQLGELGGRAQPVGVEVVDRQPGRVLLDEHEGGAADRPAVGEAEPLRHGPRQLRLAGAERADQGDYGAGEEPRPQPAAEGLGRLQVRGREGE
jgi:hypothetical protein